MHQPIKWLSRPNSEHQDVRAQTNQRMTGCGTVPLWHLEQLEDGGGLQEVGLGLWEWIIGLVAEDSKSV